MADSPDGTDSLGEGSGDDGQLTIRIPNPKVYMARQSQWKGRRGKPRCDHCRLNNLKCDRVLPTCNHCAWANGRECKYTPLPTPAHRGIPRCDRCRQRNLKCDRNLPVCNHCTEDNEVDCNYTPKKRHKVPSDHGTTRDRTVQPYVAKTASFLVSDMPNSYNGALTAADSGMIAGPSGSHVFESELRTEPQIRQYIPPHSPNSLDEEAPAEGDFEMSYQQAGPDGSFTWVRKFVLPPLPPKEPSTEHSSPTYRPPFTFDQGMIVTTPHIDPWTNSAFAPLPEVIVQTLRSVNAIEMPGRHAFDEALSKFVGALSSELRETATFTWDVYADVARAISEGSVAQLSPRLQMWTTCHHARSGSRKHHLILLPRDAFFSMSRVEEEKMRASYILQTDGEGTGEDIKHLAENGTIVSDMAAVYERVPVHSQIYDILVYTHRNHGSTSAMLYEARRIGIAGITWPMVEMFHRLCPLCKLRAKGTPRNPPEEENLSQRQQTGKR